MGININNETSIDQILVNSQNNSNDILALNTIQNQTESNIWGAQCSLVGSKTLSDGSTATFTIISSPYNSSEEGTTIDSSFTYGCSIQITLSFASGKILNSFSIITSDTTSTSITSFPYTATINQSLLYNNLKQFKFAWSTKTATTSTSWHTIYTGEKAMTKSSSTSTYTSSTFTPTGYKAITTATNIRVTAILRKSSNSGSTWTNVKTYTSQTGNITYTSGSIPSQYLSLLSTGLRSRVKSYKVGTITYTYQWLIKKVEQYY